MLKSLPTFAHLKKLSCWVKKTEGKSQTKDLTFLHWEAADLICVYYVVPSSSYLVAALVTQTKHTKWMKTVQETKRITNVGEKEKIKENKNGEEQTNPPVRTPWHQTWSRMLCTAFSPPLRSPCCTLRTWSEDSTYIIKTQQPDVTEEPWTWSRFIYLWNKTTCVQHRPPVEMELLRWSWRTVCEGAERDLWPSAHLKFRPGYSVLLLSFSSSRLKEYLGRQRCISRSRLQSHLIRMPMTPPCGQRRKWKNLHWWKKHSPLALFSSISTSYSSIFISYEHLTYKTWNDFIECDTLWHINV